MKKETKLPTKKYHTIIIVSIITFVFLGILSYWTIRPLVVKKSCSKIDMKPYSQKEKDNARDQFDSHSCTETLSFKLLNSDKIPIKALDLSKNQAHETFDSLDKDQIREKVEEILKERKRACLSLEKIFNSPSKGWQQQATNKEYALCLRNHGIDTKIITFESGNTELDKIQKDLKSQSDKINNLQKNMTSEDRNKSIPNSIVVPVTRNIVESNQNSCQQKINEYNSCLNEYHSKMTTYNTCLHESYNRNSWRYGYGTLCSKPYNYCFKPICAY